MIEALKPLGFVAIQPEKLSFDEQALTFAQADIIVCEFGAAMANAMFCRPGTKVVEIIAEGQHDPWSSHLCAMLELEHVVLFQRQSEEVLASAPRHAEGLALRLCGRRAEAGRDGEGAHGVRLERSRDLFAPLLAALDGLRTLVASLGSEPRQVTRRRRGPCVMASRSRP